MHLARLLLLVLVLALAACGGSDDEPEATDAARATTTAATTAATTTEPSLVAECETVEAPEPKPDGGQPEPPGALDKGKTYTLVFETNCGSFTIELDPRTAPTTAPSFAALAENGFFDDTTFHRVVPGFVIQGGDPTGTGTGGPGYQTVDVPPADVTYTEGVVAMAKGGTEPPGTSGSQFFVVTGADIGLPLEYAVIGKVTEGLETVRAIDNLGVGDGPPSQPVVIERVTVRKS